MIAVIGATGFIGSAVTRALLQAGHPVRALVRDEAKAHRVLGGAGGDLTLVTGDMHSPASLAELLDGARAVYVLTQTVSSPQPRGAGSFADAERRATDTIVAAARRSGTTRLITVGLIGAQVVAPNAWVRSRAELEELLVRSGLDVTVLRAGLVAGVGSVGFNGLLAASDRPQARIRGTGYQRWSYIGLDDLVGYLVDTLEVPATHGKVYDVGSTEAPTYRELLATTARLRGHQPPTVRTTPLWLLRAIAPVLERSKGLAPGGLRAAIDHLGDDLVGDTRPIRAVLPRRLLTWEQCVTAATGAEPAPTATIR